MHLIRIGDVVVKPNRHRTDFNDKEIKSLVDDILRPHGLLHPIVLENDNRTLVAGERRLRAVADIWQDGPSTPKEFNHAGEKVPVGHIPYITLGELTEDELEEAQLSENIRRVDLSWQEVIQAKARLFALRTKQGASKVEITAEIKAKSVETITPGEITYHITDAVILAQNLHRPAVRNAKSQQEAYRILAREAENELRAYVGASTMTEFSGHRVINGDLIYAMENAIPAGIISCIIADPPYGVNSVAFGSQSDIDHEYTDTPEYASKLYQAIAHFGRRVCQPDAHAYIFCDITYFEEMKNIFLLQGWEVCPRPLIWDKDNAGIIANQVWYPRYTYEAILYARLGNRPSTGLYRSVLKIPSLKHKLHAAQKPVQLYKELISRSCYSGEIVLDPCCGCGPIFPAANVTGTRAIGVELSKPYYDVSVSRINDKEEVQ